MEDESKKNPIIVGVVAVAIVVVLVGAVIALGGKEENQVSDSTASQTTSTAPEAVADDTSAAGSTATTAGAYKSGTYEATGAYNSPGGKEEIDVKVTLNGNTITDVTATPQAASSTSKEYQSAFVSGYKNLVVGKNIDDVKLSKVSGSSLTPRGFNDALDEIRSEAKS